ncbi:MAG TPA: TonB-dependent receptor [Longimicrobiales bacterium]|nr:TonB-dependent receptor [Longimicrobiales bacterium]
MNVTLARLAAASVLLILVPAAAAAQEARDTFDLAELVVTANRLPMPERAVPAPVTVLDGDALRARGITRVADALGTIPGLSLVETGSWGGRTSLFLRGGESDYVQVLLDGVPLNAPGGALDLSTLTLDNIARIEVVRGPASVLYGSDAVTGVIQLFTKDGRGPTRLRASARAGSLGTTDWDLAASGGAERISWSLAGGRFDTDGAYAFNNDFRDDVVSGRLTARPDAVTRLSLSGRWNDARFHYPTDGAGALVDRNARQDTEQGTLSLELEHMLGGRVRLTARAGGHQARGLILDRPDDAEDPDLLRVDSEVRRLTADLQGDLYFGPATALSLGLSGVRHSEQSATYAESAFGPYESAFDQDRGTRGVYAQVVTGALPRTTLTAGTRLEDSDAFGAHATWRGGVSLDAGRGVRLRGVYGTAFKEPTMLENFGVGGVRGNPDLDPEESRSWEVGADASRGPLTLGATWFDQRFTNLIDFTFEPPSPEDPQYFNVAGATSRGLELSGEAAIMAGVTASASYTWLGTEVTDPGFDSGEDALFAPGDRLLRRPTHAAGARLGWDAGRWGGYGVAARWTGERVDQDFAGWPPARVTLESYTLLDAWADVPLLRGEGARPTLAATLRIENILDEAYQDPANFPGRGRVVLVGARAGLGF